jgi:hypothetical protein
MFVFSILQLCQWHKRENVVRCLQKAQAAAWRRWLQQGLRAPDVCEARTVPGPAVSGTSGPQRLGRRQSGRRSRGDVDPPPPGALSDSGSEPQVHQLAGIPERSTRPADRQGGSLADRGTETPLGGQCVATHKAALTVNQRLPPSAAFARGPSD